MSFLYDIFNQLKTAEKTTVLRELNDQESPQQVSFGVTGKGLLMQVSQARRFLAGKGLGKGDRCALLAHNSIEWVAMDLAIMAEGLIVVPLYARQAPAELVAMMKDCSPSLLCCSDVTLRDAITQHWPEARPRFLFDEIFTGPRDLALDQLQVAESDVLPAVRSGRRGAVVRADAVPLGGARDRRVSRRVRCAAGLRVGRARPADLCVPASRADRGQVARDVRRRRLPGARDLSAERQSGAPRPSRWLRGGLPVSQGRRLATRPGGAPRAACRTAERAGPPRPRRARQRRRAQAAPPAPRCGAGGDRPRARQDLGARDREPHPRRAEISRGDESA